MAAGLKEQAPSRDAAAKKAVDTPVFRMLAKALELPPPRLETPAPKEYRLPRAGRDKGAGSSSAESPVARIEPAENPEPSEGGAVVGPSGSVEREDAPSPVLSDRQSAPTSGLSVGGQPAGAPRAPVAVAPSAPAPGLAGGVAERDASGLSSSAARQLLTGRGTPTSTTTGVIVPPPVLSGERTLPTAGAVAPPILGSTRAKDQNHNGIDDRLDALLREIEAKRKAPERIRVLVTLWKPYTQAQLKAFLELGGEIRHTFEAVRYGFSGVISVDLVDDLATKLGSDLNIIEPVMPVPGN